ALRRALMAEFLRMNGKVIGDKEYDDIESQEAWDKRKQAEKDAEEAIKAWNDLPPDKQKTEPKPAPLPKMTTCIGAQQNMLKNAIKNAGLKLIGKTNAFATDAVNAANAIGPDVFHAASAGMSERPKVGDIYVLAQRGQSVDNAAKEV